MQAGGNRRTLPNVKYSDLEQLSELDKHIEELRKIRVDLINRLMQQCCGVSSKQWLPSSIISACYGLEDGEVTA